MSVVVPHLLTKEVMVDVGLGGMQKIETFTPCMQVIPLRNTGDKNYQPSEFYFQRKIPLWFFFLLKKYKFIHCRKMFKELSRIRFFFFNISQRKALLKNLAHTFQVLYIHIYPYLRFQWRQYMFSLVFHLVT